MLYPAELQALPQARSVTLAQRETWCLARLTGKPIGGIGQKSIGKQQFLTICSLLVSQKEKLFCLCTGEAVFLLAKGPGKSNEGD